MGNGNSRSSKSKGHEPQYVPRQGRLTTTKSRVANFPTQYGASSFRGEYVNKPKAETPYNSEQHGKKSVLDNDDTFTDYILRAKQKIRRTVSNVGRENSDSAVPTVEPSVANGGSNNNKENYRSDQFSEFIQVAKKKLRTTSRVGKNGSFRRG